MRISDWSSDVCSSDLQASILGEGFSRFQGAAMHRLPAVGIIFAQRSIGVAALVIGGQVGKADGDLRSEERRVGKECAVRVDLGGRRIIKKKKEIDTHSLTRIQNLKQL